MTGPDRSTVERVLAANRYLVLGTSDANGDPWVTPVFFAPHGPNRLVWVSSPDSRHSRNIARRTSVAITVFDSSVEVGHAEAVYVDADAAPATPDGTPSALAALNSRVPPAKRLSSDDLHPLGPLVVYEADVRRWYVLVRGGDGTADRSVEV